MEDWIWAHEYVPVPEERMIVDFDIELPVPELEFVKQGTNDARH